MPFSMHCADNLVLFQQLINCVECVRVALVLVSVVLICGRLRVRPVSVHVMVGVCDDVNAASQSVCCAMV